MSQKWFQEGSRRRDSTACLKSDCWKSKIQTGFFTNCPSCSSLFLGSTFCCKAAFLWSVWEQSCFGKLTLWSHQRQGIDQTTNWATRSLLVSELWRRFGIRYSESSFADSEKDVLTSIVIEYTVTNTSTKELNVPHMYLSSSCCRLEKLKRAQKLEPEGVNTAQGQTQVTRVSVSPSVFE